MSDPGQQNSAYQALQQGKSLVGLANTEASSQLLQLMAPQSVPRQFHCHRPARPVPASSRSGCWRSTAGRRARNATLLLCSLMPRRLDWGDPLPLVWLDLPTSGPPQPARSRANPARERSILLTFPSLLLQNFHHQNRTLTERSLRALSPAAWKSCSTARPIRMRRRPAGAVAAGSARLSRPQPGSCGLDCGHRTGRTLRQLRAALPGV